MAEDRQPPTVVEGATTGDVEDEVPTAKSAEDRKAAAALSKLDSRGDDEEGAVGSKHVDHEAVSRAMDSLGGDPGKKTDDKKDVKKVKVDPADVALLVDELELTKNKATDLLRAHDGDAIEAMRAYIKPNVN